LTHRGVPAHHEGPRSCKIQDCPCRCTTSPAGVSPASNLPRRRAALLGLVRAVLRRALGSPAAPTSAAGHPLRAVPGFGAGRAVADRAGSRITIAPLDTLKVSVFQVPDLSGEFEVDLTGNIAMPLIGNVRAVDLTTAELDQKISQAARRQISAEPGRQRRRQVHRAQRHVDGSVRSPGPVPGERADDADAGGRAGQGHRRECQSAPRRRVPADQGQRMAAAFDLTASAAARPRIRASTAATSSSWTARR
jgi:polysaccharide export outer membrane protein